MTMARVGFFPSRFHHAPEPSQPTSVEWSSGRSGFDGGTPPPRIGFQAPFRETVLPIGFA